MGKAIKCDVDSERIRAAIKKSGLKQQEIAEKLNVNYQAFNRRLNQGKFTPLELTSLSFLLNCDPEYLKGTTEENCSFQDSVRKEVLARKEAEKTDLLPSIKVRIEFQGDQKDFYFTCENAPLSVFVSAIIQAGGLKELRSEIETQTGLLGL